MSLIPCWGANSSGAGEGGSVEPGSYSYFDLV